MSIWLKVGLVILIVAVAYAPYNAASHLRDSQVLGCARGKLSNAANAKAWRAAETARRAGSTELDRDTADLYADVASGLERRSRIVCARVYPKPSLFPKVF